MIGPVDVLAVLDSVLEGQQTHSEIVEASAALFALFDAVDEVVRTGQGVFRLKRALANVKGAA